MYPHQATGTGLRTRLRAETADWHAQVEAVADVPGAIRTRADYAEFLRRLHGLHAHFERRLAVRRFDAGWKGIGVEIAAHRRAYMLADDLTQLGDAVSGSAPVELPPLATLGHALGCLYVLEGSALGGPLVAGIVQARIGPVPTTFLTGPGRRGRRGRRQLTAWPAVLAALERFDTQGGNGNDVVAGACDTFAAFAAHLRQLSPAGSRLQRSASGSR